MIKKCFKTGVQSTISVKTLENLSVLIFLFIRTKHKHVGGGCWSGEMLFNLKQFWLVSTFRNTFIFCNLAQNSHNFDININNGK